MPPADCPLSGNNEVLDQRPDWQACGVQLACFSLARTLANTAPQVFKISGIGDPIRRGSQSIQQQATESLTILVLANQLAHIFAARAVAAFGDLSIDKVF